MPIPPLPLTWVMSTKMMIWWTGEIGEALVIGGRGVGTVGMIGAGVVGIVAVVVVVVVGVGVVGVVVVG